MENQNSPSGIDDSEIQELRQEIINQIDDRISSVMTSLPPQYFQQLGDAERLEHFKALVAVKVCGIDQEITLKKQDGSRVSVISCENYPGQLARMVEDLPDDFPLVGANIFTSAGEDFIVDVFEFRIDVDEETLASETDFKNLDNLVQQVMGLTERSQEAVEDFIKRYHKNHQILDSPEEIAQQFVALKETEHINDIKVLW